MYIATGQGQISPGDKSLMSTETSCHFGHLLQVSKKSFWSLSLYNFFMILYIYIAPRLTTPWGRNFMSTGTSSLWSFVVSFKKISLKSDFIQFFSMILCMCIAPGQGQTAPRGQSFDVNRNVLSLLSFVASFKKSLILYLAQEQGQTSPGGQMFYINRKALSLYPFVASFKEISLKSDFIQFFSWFNTCI